MKTKNIFLLDGVKVLYGSKEGWQDWEEELLKEDVKENELNSIIEKEKLNGFTTFRISNIQLTNDANCINNILKQSINL